jgi:hypothetical protein
MATAEIQTQAESVARVRKICVLMVIPPAVSGHHARIGRRAEIRQ